MPAGEEPNAKEMRHSKGAREETARAVNVISVTRTARSAKVAKTRAWIPNP